MAYITKRGSSYGVRYTYQDEQGKNCNKWESFSTKEEAINRKKQIEHELANGTFLIPSTITVKEFLMEWLPKQCNKHKWAPQTYQSNLGTVQNLIIPYIGDMQMQKLKPYHLEDLYSTLSKTPCGQYLEGKKQVLSEKQQQRLLSGTTIHEVHRLLRTAFQYAVEWGILIKSPVPVEAPKKTTQERSIWEVDYDEIADLDAGSWFDPAYANARISTLEDVLRFVGGKVQLNIEIKPTKHNTDDLEQNVADLIAQYGYEDKCWVTSFSYTSLKKVKQANPNIRTGYIMSVAYGRFYTLKYADAFSLNKVFITRQVVNSAHQAGKQVFAWTVNSTSEVRSLCNLHVDSIITDDPVMAQQVIARNNSSETLRTILDYLVN